MRISVIGYFKKGKKDVVHYLLEICQQFVQFKNVTKWKRQILERF